MEGTQLVIEWNGELEGVRIPFLMTVDPIDRTKLTHDPDTYALRLIMETNKTCPIAVYPAKEQFLEDLGEALKNLELIRDMSVYERIYEALGMFSFEGRPFQKKLRQFCEQAHILMDETRYAQMERYVNYPYMKKKWQAYRKRQRRQLADWEIVYGRFWKFLMPLWRTALDGMVYLGSWMPDLGRYLD